MPWNGSGIFQRLFSWAQDAQNNVNIQGARMDQDTNDIVAGLNNCLTRDGQGVPGTAINWNGQRLYNVAAPAVAADVANKGYVDTANAVQAKNMAGYQINALGAPSSSTDAATKGYVDSTVVSTSLPGLAGNQGKVLSGTGGGVGWMSPGIGSTTATVTSATTLAGAYQFVPVAMGAALQAVTLPAATTLSLGGPHYWMRNYGTYPFELRDNSGVLLAVVPARGQILVTMTGNGNAAGVWSVGNVSEFGGLSTFIEGVAGTANGTGSLAGLVVLSLSPSPNIYILFWGNNGGAGAIVATLNGATVSFGAPYSPLSGNNNVLLSCAAISPSTLLFVCANSGANLPQAVVATISGTSFSLGASINLGTGSNSGFGSACVALSNTTGLALWAGSSHCYAEVITISGSTLTPNTIYNIDSVMASGNSYAPSLTQISSTTALAIGEVSSGTGMSAVVLTVSGTVVSTGIALTGIDTNCSTNTVQALGGGNFLVTYNTGGTLNAPSGAIKMVVLSVNGTTVTAGTPITVLATGGTFCNSILQTTQGYSGYCFYSVSNGGYYTLPFTISGTTITLNGSATLLAPAGTNTNLGAFNVAGTGESLLFGITPAGTLFGQTVEFVK